MKLFDIGTVPSVIQSKSLIRQVNVIVSITQHRPFSRLYPFILKESSYDVIIANVGEI